MIATRTKGYAWGTLQIQADFSKPDDFIHYRQNRKDGFLSSPITVAAASHNPARACTLINQWIHLEPKLKPNNNNKKKGNL